MCRMGTYTPSPLQCVNFRNVFSSDSGVRAFSEPISSAFAFMQREYYLYFLVISRNACSLVVIAVRSKRPTVVAFSPSFWDNLFVDA